MALEMLVPAKPSSMGCALPVQHECGSALSSVHCSLLPQPLQEAGVNAEQAMELLVSSQPEPPPFRGAKQILHWEDRIVSRCTGCSRPALCVQKQSTYCAVQRSTPLRDEQRPCMETPAKCGTVQLLSCACLAQKAVFLTRWRPKGP